jgi:hypothetical protein
MRAAFVRCKARRRHAPRSPANHAAHLRRVSQGANKVYTKATKDTKIAKKAEITLRAKRIPNFYFATFVSFVIFVSKFFL